MITRSTDNNPYLLVAGTDQPQRNAQGNPIPNPNYGKVTETGEPDSLPQPNNPGNPYFGKTPLIPKQFWGLVLQVYIVQQGSNGAGLDRLARLLESKRAQPIIRVADAVALIDPDDKDGDFLQMSNLLTTTSHETDAQLLITPAEFAAIMSAWK